MGHAKDRILPVRLIEARDHVLDARGPHDRERAGIGALSPTHHGELAEPVDVVGMEVGVEDGAHVSLRQAHGGHHARGSCPAVHHVEPISAHDRHAGTGAVGVGQRRTRTAYRNVETFRKLAQQVAAQVLLDHAGH